jgi:hypothetical protein
MDRIAVFDFIPKFCPHCGEETMLDYDNNIGSVLVLKLRQEMLTNYNLGRLLDCKCGLQHQRVHTKDILKIAEDLRDYYGRR